MAGPVALDIMAGKSGVFVKDDDYSKTKLSVPPEVLELIFWHMDEGTFFIALKACRQFSEIGSTRKNLLHQVGRLPGLRPGLEDLYGRKLRKECYERASTSGCMASVLADIRTCKLPSGTMLSSSGFSENTPTKKCWSQCNHSQLALANNDNTINIYSLTDEDVRPTLTLDLHTTDNWNCPTRIAALAFSPIGDLVVLHEHGEYICYGDHKPSYHYIDAKFGPEHVCRIRKIYELTTFFGCNRDGRDSISCQTECRRGRVLALEDAIPIGLALASTGHASIAWKVDSPKTGCQYRIEIARTSKNAAMDVDSDLGDADGLSFSQLTTTIFDAFNETQFHCKFLRMNFVQNDSKLLIHSAAIPVHSHCRFFDRGAEDEPCISSTSRVNTNGLDGSTRLFNVGTPFHGAHFSNVALADETQAVCVKSYLALGLADETRYKIPECGIHYLYILQHDAISRPNLCKHSVDLDRDFPHAHWIPVALLAGWRQNRGTMGSLLEINPRRNRIASAAWDQVLFWTFDPEPLHQGGLEYYFPPRDYNARKGFGRIRPIMLPHQGVVHAMKWINDNVLFALTDKGLVKWSIGSLALGRRNID